MSPHSANIDRAKVDQQCGGILARLQPVYARGKEFWKRICLERCSRTVASRWSGITGRIRFWDESRRPI